MASLKRAPFPRALSRGHLTVHFGILTSLYYQGIRPTSISPPELLQAAPVNWVPAGKAGRKRKFIKNFSGFSCADVGGLYERQMEVKRTRACVGISAGAASWDTTSTGATVTVRVLVSQSVRTRRDQLAE